MKVSFDEFIKYKAILLDVGNVIYHDLPVEFAFGFYVFQELRKYSNIQEDFFFEFRNSKLNEGNVKWAEELCVKICKEQSQSIIFSAWENVLTVWKDISIPIDGAISKIKELSKAKSLIIAANQPVQTLQMLEKNGILNCFTSIFFDSMIDYTKPDVNFYKYILRKIRLMPNDVIMVGDRVDNDIYPSNIIGIDTAWIQYKPLEIKVKHIPLDWQEEYFKNYKLIGMHSVPLINVNKIKVRTKYCANSLAELFDFEINGYI